MRLFALLAVLLVVAPSVPVARAGWLGSIDVPVSRPGATFAYRETTIEEGALVQRTIVLRDEGVQLVAGAWGEPLLARTTRLDASQAGALESSVLCHRLVSNGTPVRLDVLGGTILYSTSRFVGGSGTTLLPPLQDETTHENVTGGVLFDPYVVDSYCPLDLRAQGASLPSVGSVALDEIAGGFEPGARSQPAVRASFAGRDALDYAVASPTARPGASQVLHFVFAEGIPGLAEVWRDVVWQGRHPPAGYKLTAFEDGPEAPPSFAPVAGPTPDVLRAPFERLAFDDSGWDLPFRSRDAFEAARAAPETGLASWLAAHPDAVLVGADYAGPAAFDANPPGFVGTWSFLVLEGEKGWQVSVSRIMARVGPLEEPVDQFSALHEISVGGDLVQRGPLPTSMASPAQMAAHARAEGFPEGPPARLVYRVFSPKAEQGDATAEPFVWASAPVPAAGQGARREAALDGLTGKLGQALQFSAQSHDSGLLAAPTNGIEAIAQASSPLVTLAGPIPVGMAGAAAAGLAVLALLAKFLLLPLFSRLRKSRLLDNPARAKLLALVREEPGVHLSALERALGLGAGATRHHLDVLARNGFVAAIEEPGRLRYYAVGAVPPEVARREALLKGARMRDVYEAFARQPDLSLRAAAATLGMSAPGVHRCKKRLEGAGLLPADRDSPQNP